MYAAALHASTRSTSPNNASSNRSTSRVARAQGGGGRFASRPDQPLPPAAWPCSNDKPARTTAAGKEEPDRRFARQTRRLQLGSNRRPAHYEKERRRHICSLRAILVTRSPAADARFPRSIRRFVPRVMPRGGRHIGAHRPTYLTDPVPHGSSSATSCKSLDRRLGLWLPCRDERCPQQPSYFGRGDQWTTRPPPPACSSSSPATSTGRPACRPSDADDPATILDLSSPESSTAAVHPGSEVVSVGRGGVYSAMVWWSVNCTNGPTELIRRAGRRDDLQRGYWGAAFVR
ncbi:hypothetical protein EV652_10359 [Kribbella steppae]|uniref:Uncharacterized protein n=1 Tax=Kribbella steppae TaxID=2512223 RepID=A0A4V2S0K9_9ACTN|nr:hypothetical protein EV652_10359 [Kribbella steppae]